MAITERRKQWVYGALGCVTLLVCASFSAGLSDGGPKAIVFNVRRTLAIGLVDGHETWLYTYLPSIDDRTIGYYVLPSLEAPAPVETIHFMSNDSVSFDPLVYLTGGGLQFVNTR